MVNPEIAMRGKEEGKKERKGKNRQHAARIAASLHRLLPLFLALLLPFACQEPVQPDALIVPVTVTVQVEDGNGSPIPNAIVEYAPVAAGLNGGLQGTNSRGIYSIADLQVPISGQEYLFRVTAPPDDPELGGASETRVILLPCRDTLLRFVFVRTREIVCGRIAESESIILSACTDSSDGGELTFRNTTGVPLTMTVTDPAVPALAVEARRADVVQASPFALGVNESFDLTAIFAPQANGDGGSGIVTVEGRDGNGALCYRAQVNVTALLRPCDSPGPGVCSIDTAASTLLLSAPNDSIRARVGTQGARTLCIRNVGEGELTVRAAQVVNNPLFDVRPSELTIPPGGSDCFTVSFSPTAAAVWPGGRGTAPAIRAFFDSILIDGCGITIPARGVPDTTFPAILNNCRTPYSYRNQRCGDRINESGQIITECEKDSTEFDWYVDFADPVSRTGRLLSENAQAPFKLVRSGYVPPAATGFSCSDPAIASQISAACDDRSGWTNSLDLSMGDIMLFRKGNQCWALFINSINDANVEGKPLICYDICRVK